MGVLGKWWGTQRRTTDPESSGPETAQLRIGRRRRPAFSWGSAHDVELGPAPPPDARTHAPREQDDVPWFGTWRSELEDDLEPDLEPYAGPRADARGGPAPRPGHGRGGEWSPARATSTGTAAVPSDPPADVPSGLSADIDDADVATPPRGTPSIAVAPPWRRHAAVALPPVASSLGNDSSAAPSRVEASDARTTGSARDMSPSPDDATRRPAGAPDALGHVPAAPRPDDPRADDPRPGAPRVADAGADSVFPEPPDAPFADDEASTTVLAAAPPTTVPADDAFAADRDTDAPAAAVPPAPVAAPRHAAPEADSRPVVAPDTEADTDTDRSPLDTPARAVQGRLGIDGVTPEVEGGRFPSKAVVGEVVPVGATVWREGHDAVAATLVWAPAGEEDTARSSRMVGVGVDADRVAGSFVPDHEGPWTFRVDAWSDPWATWRHAVEVKAAAGQGAAELANDLETGARLLDRGADGIEAIGSDGDARRTGPLPPPPSRALATACREAATGLRDTDASLPVRLAGALAEPIHRTMTEHPVRELVTRGATHHVHVERSVALAGSWYEFFPRSTGGRDADGAPVHGTFATAARELDRVAAMGFDVAYLPPIHPVGSINRKGPNNTLTPGPTDVGSPWAIGSVAGGHDAIEPKLGTIDDFDDFVARARALDIEVALDLALQCAPDHPWAASHPEWFVVRPDGTIAYAENPPKKYQDIYPVHFDTDPEGIYAEVLRVVLYWVEHGVRVFRVDNPHTKPPDFWAWLIAEVQRRDPGVVFLAEAFTRPARLFGLARLGFSQSYTYFTWRTGKQELQEFFETHRDRIDECRPNCFVNTPDILHESLQRGGQGMFALRAALAALLSPTWGVYSGYELFEHLPVREGSEEYLDSEKYQLRPRDFAGALAAGRSLEPWITRLNHLRRAHPALRQIRTLRFHDIDNDALLAFSKTDPRTGDAVICVITLNPFATEDGTLRLDMPALGMNPGDRFTAHDEVSGQLFDWGQANYVRLEPWRDVAHVVSVRRR